MAPDYDKKVPKSDKKYLKKAGGHIGRNVVQIIMKMRTIVRIIQIILNIKPHQKIQRVTGKMFSKTLGEILKRK